MKQKCLLSRTYCSSHNAEIHVHLGIFCFGRMILVTSVWSQEPFIKTDAELIIEIWIHSRSWIGSVEILMFWFLSGGVGEESYHKSGKLVFLMGLSTTEMPEKKKPKQP